MLPATVTTLAIVTQDQAALRAAASCAAPSRCGSSDSVYGAISKPS